MIAMAFKRINSKSDIILRAANLFSASFILGALYMVGIVAQPVIAKEIVLEDRSLLIAFDSQSGALTRLEDKTSGWAIERRPRLGISFRMFAPLPERRWNPILGPKQQAIEVKKISEHDIHLQWKNVVSENGGILPISLTANVTLTNGVLTFNATLENDSALTVETIDYPYFGDFNSSSRESTNMMAVWTMQRSNVDHLTPNEIYPHFRNEKGYWGVFWPTKILDANLSPFCLIQSPDKGVYVGVDAARSPYSLRYTFEQHPGVLSGINSLVPSEDVIDGKPVHLEFRVCHLIFEKPHSTIKLVPIIARCYQGDEHAGGDIYKQWRPTLPQ